MRVSLIAALAQNRVIGGDNRLLWHIPEDLKRFRTITSGHPVIMGRKTYDSIGRALPNRLNLVITRNAQWSAAGVVSVASLEEALSRARESGTDECFVIGGGEIYRQSLPLASRLYLTWVPLSPEGDTVFPEWDDKEFREIERVQGASCEFVTLERQAASS